MRNIQLNTPRGRALVVVALFVVPILLRVLFFYQLPYWNSAIQAPNYAAYSIPEPPTASAKPAPAAAVAAGKVILVDNAHSNQVQADELEPFVTAISARGARVEFDKGDKTLQARLKYASAYLIFSPGSSYSGDELLQIQQFVASGGRLVVFTDPTHSLVQYDSVGNATVYPDVNYANPVLAPYGLSFINDYLYDLKRNEGNFRNVELTAFGAGPLTRDLKMVVFYGAHSIETQAGAAQASGNADVLSSLTDQGGHLSPLVLGANGQVLALGDFTFLTDPYNQVADNDLLMARLADFVVGGQRTPLLSNFPFVFQHPVSLVAAGEVSMGSSLLGPVAALQQALRSVNVPLAVSAHPTADNDTIVLGTFAGGDDLDAYLQPFDVTLDNPQTIYLQGFGRIAQAGTGVLLFESGPKSNTLVLLTHSPSDLPALIKLVASGDLSSCVVQGNTGVCGLGSGVSSGSSSSFGGFYETATPTPAG